MVLFTRMFTQVQGAIMATEAIMALRILSSFSSMLAILFGYLTIKTIATHEGWHKGATSSWNFFLTVCSLLLFIFSPALIQFAHFGTTESFLMLTYSLLMFLSVKFMYNSIPKDTYVFLSAMTVGLAAAAKISSLVFLAFPLILLFRYIKKPFEWMFFVLSGIFYTVVFLLLFSPHNLISLPEFITTIRYESDVALGAIEVFYTRSLRTLSLFCTSCSLCSPMRSDGLSTLRFSEHSLDCRGRNVHLMCSVSHLLCTLYRLPLHMQNGHGLWRP